MCKQLYIFFEIILNKKFLVSKTQDLNCHELIFCKWVNLQKPRYWDESQDKKLGRELQTHNQEFFGAKQVSWNRGTSIYTSRTTFKRRVPQGKNFVFFLQDTLKTTFQVRISPIDAHKQGNLFQNQSTFCLFSKKTGETSPSPLLVARLSQIYFLKRG